MKKILFLITLNSILFFLSCNSQQGKSVVKDFINAYNSKDSVATFNLLHEDFVEYYENNIAIASKSDYSKNYSWGKIMNDKMKFEITKTNGDTTIKTLSTYYSDRDNLLKVSPYKSVRTFFIKNQQIIKIVENKFPDSEEYNSLRGEQYAAFFNWLSVTHHQTINDYKFDHNGAIKLKEVLIEYSKKK